MIFFEALERAFEAAEHIPHAVYERVAAIDAGRAIIEAAVENIHEASPEVIGSHVGQLAAAEQVTPIVDPNEQSMAAQVDAIFDESQRDYEADAQAKIDAAFAEIYKNSPDLPRFDEDILAQR